MGTVLFLHFIPGYILKELSGNLFPHLLGKFLWLGKPVLTLDLDCPAVV